MSLMNNIFHQYLDKFVLTFIDDILIYLKNLEENKRHLEIALKILREHQLYTKYIKCEFYKDKIQHLGHTITQEVIVVDPKKTNTAMEWHVSKNVVDIKSVL